MNAVDRLLEKDVGFAIVEPPFSKFDQRIGKFSAMRPGYATNGGCYHHAAGFKAVADCMMGRAEEAWRTLVKVAPDHPDNPVEQSLTEPFSFTNCYNRNPEAYGQSFYPWRTGTCAWFTMALVEWMLGARRHYDGLLISPCLSSNVKHAKLKRTFRNTIFHIAIDNTAGRCTEIYSLILDGQPVEGNIINLFDGGEHSVSLVI